VNVSSCRATAVTAAGLSLVAAFATRAQTIVPAPAFNAAAAPVTVAAAPAANLENGAQLYRDTCLPCHGPDGGGGAGGGAALTSALTRETALAVMIEGRNTMPAFGELYTTQQMRDIAAYVVERLAVGRN
jgi:mono/diheme cytochrome c family protein